MANVWGFGGRDEGERGQEVDGEDDEDEGWLRSSWQERADERGAALQQTEIEDEDDAEDDDFGDDFDEFAEGEEHEDFGDFDEPQKETPPPSKPPAPDILAGLVSCNMPPTFRPSHPIPSHLAMPLNPKHEPDEQAS